MYKTDSIVSQYCEFHYGDENFGVKNFSKEIAKIALKYSTIKRKALDIGCAVGRSSFELANEFQYVDGMDFSDRFIEVATEMKENKKLKYERLEEGSLVSYQERTLEEIGLNKSYNNITFLQQDATNLKPIYKDYDLVIAVNLIDRLNEPLAFLKEIGSRINKNGVLLIASPYTWLEEYTPKEKWLGGYKKDGEDITTFRGLEEVLSKEFTLITNPIELEFVIRETKHKFQHTISEVTLWRKK